MPEKNTEHGIEATDPETAIRASARRLGFPEVIDPDEPVLLPLDRWRIGVARLTTAQRFRETVESRRAQGFMVEEHLFSDNDITPHQNKILEAYRTLCRPRDAQVKSLWTVLGEALSNGVRCRQDDGRPFSPEQYREARVIYGVEPQSDDWSDFLVYVSDKGKGFNPYTVLNPRNIENMELPNGRGLLMMGNSMSISQDSVGGQIIYLPQQDSSDGDLRCTELILAIRSAGKPLELITRFRDWYDFYLAPERLEKLTGEADVA